MNKLISFTSGKKTYVCFLLLLTVFVLARYGVVGVEDAKALEGVLLGLGGLSMRAALNK